jgi:hypothetical protein
MAIGTGGIFGNPVGPFQRRGVFGARETPQASPMPEAPSPQRRGLFGGELNINPRLAVLSQIFSSLGGQQSPVFAMAMEQQAMRNRAQQEAEQAGRQRADQRDEWLFREQWERDNPEPTSIERNVGAWQNMTPEQRAAYGQMQEAQQGPVTLTLPNGQLYSGPRSGLTAAMGAASTSLDNTPTVEDGFTYTPGPGGRGNQANWRQNAGGRPAGAAPFPVTP